MRPLQSQPSVINLISDIFSPTHYSVRDSDRQMLSRNVSF